MKVYQFDKSKKRQLDPRERLEQIRRQVFGVEAKVVDLSKHRDSAANGNQWHQYCDLLRLKYGTDWSFTWGFNFDAATREELTNLKGFYLTTMQARGIKTVRMPKDWPKSFEDIMNEYLDKSRKESNHA